MGRAQRCNGKVIYRPAAAAWLRAAENADSSVVSVTDCIRVNFSRMSADIRWRSMMTTQTLVLWVRDDLPLQEAGPTKSRHHCWFSFSFQARSLWKRRCPLWCWALIILSFWWPVGDHFVNPFFCVVLNQRSGLPWRLCIWILVFLCRAT